MKYLLNNNAENMQKEKPNACEISSSGLWNKVPGQCFMYSESFKFYVL